MAGLCLFLLLIIFTKAYAQLDCEAKVQLDFLDQMIDAQLHTSCHIEVKLIEKDGLPEYCYHKGVIKVLLSLFNLLKFKEGSESFNNVKQLQKLYNKHEICLKEKTEDIQLNDISACLRTTYLSPVQILQTFKDYFTIMQNFKPNKEYDEKCEDFYENCSMEGTSSAEEQNGRRKKEHEQNMYLFMVASLLAVVFLCGLLYSVYRYRLLRRQLNRERALGLPEQQPLHFQLQDV